ncbi:MAG: glucans biosynthesis glucosyltransferase MdoH [Pseudomonas fluorescens]|nr:MAG: glucans biosynthesis glucosyltransferase MdoH [Pseudomonas fluorescens]
MSPLTRPTITSGMLILRRLTLIVPATILTALGCYLAWTMVGGLDGEANVLDIIGFGVFCLLFAMLATTSWAMMLGLIVWFAGRKNVPLEEEAMAIPLEELVPSRGTRTAILIPAYHEDPKEVFARVRTMRASLAALQPFGVKSDIDMFVLSDSQKPEAIEAEAEEYRACIASMPAHGPTVFYRRRENNAKYKVGNVEEFCVRWGQTYDHMLVLDADSLMAGETIRRMITLMERHPRVGLLQTCFIPTGRDTLFCRVMQFSTRLYLMPSAMGLEYWQGANANYWGHNALIRTRAFMETCGLPELPGKAPLGGRILSHDIVEAAFIARGGWEAFLLPNIPGTYEELPTNLIDFMQRDRRWCAGNLQHQHIIRADGVHFVNRLHMILGIMSYASGPLWLAFIMMALTATVMDASGSSVHLATAGLFSSAVEGRVLFGLTLFLLFAPKLVTLALALVRPTVRKSFGGANNIVRSAILEQLFVMVQQPAVMLFYTTFVLMPLCGHVVKWESQPRSERGISWREAFLRHRYHVALAAVLTGVLVYLNSLAVMYGVLPVIIGLTLSPAFTVVTSRASVGVKARNRNLFLTQDELNPSAELKMFQQLVDEPRVDAKGDVVLPLLPGDVPGHMPEQLLRFPDAPIALGRRGKMVMSKVEA